MWLRSDGVQGWDLTVAERVPRIPDGHTGTNRAIAARKRPWLGFRVRLKAVGRCLVSQRRVCRWRGDAGHQELYVRSDGRWPVSERDEAAAEPNRTGGSGAAA